MMKIVVFLVFSTIFAFFFNAAIQYDYQYRLTFASKFQQQ